MRNRHSEEHIVLPLKHLESGATVQEMCLKMGSTGRRCTTADASTGGMEVGHRDYFGKLAPDPSDRLTQSPSPRRAVPGNLAGFVFQPKPAREPVGGRRHALLRHGEQAVHPFRGHVCSALSRGFAHIAFTKTKLEGLRRLTAAHLPTESIV